MNIQEYLASKLNEEQCKAALHTDTSSLILAGAGSGKTRTLTYKIAYLMFGLGVKPSNILAVTFTNKAANELKERLIDLAKEFSELDLGVEEKVSSKDIQGDSIDDFLAFVESTAEKKNNISYGVNDFKRIGTFHSIFLKILKEDIEGLEMKYDKTFSIIDADDSAKVVKDLLKKYNLEDVLKPNEVKGFISNEKNNGFDAKMFETKVVSQYDMNMGKIYTEYQKELERSNMLDFDDLLLLPYLLFRKKPEILEKWKNKFLYIMVDEAQDTNWIQFELMKMLSEDKILTEEVYNGNRIKQKDVKIYSLDIPYPEIKLIKYEKSGNFNEVENEIAEKLISFIEGNNLFGYSFIPVLSREGDFLFKILDICNDKLKLLGKNIIIKNDIIKIDMTYDIRTKSTKIGSRKELAYNKYCFKSKNVIVPNKIVLLDDIYESGSTCEALCEKIFGKNPNAEILFLALFHKI